jgi:DNA-binding MarR family transcriptional regulator
MRQLTYQPKLVAVDTDRGHAPGSEPWLDADQQRAWRALVGLFTTLPAAIESDLQRTSGLTMFEYLVLASLSETQAGKLQMSDLAARANSSLSRLSHVVSRLEKRGWVTRQACLSDGRASEAVLTDAGAAKVVAAAPDHARAVRELVVDALSPAQLEELGVAAAAVVERIARQTRAPRRFIAT